MAKFGCRCGHVLNLSIGLADYELALVPESRIADIGSVLDKGEKLTDDSFYGLIDEKKKTVYICPKCSRLYLEDDGDAGTFTGYAIEPPEPADE